MSLLFSAFIITLEMIGVFFLAFFAMFLLALLLMPIENRLTGFVWRHNRHDGEVPEPSFREFSRRHR